MFWIVETSSCSGFVTSHVPLMQPRQLQCYTRTTTKSPDQQIAATVHVQPNVRKPRQDESETNCALETSKTVLKRLLVWFTKDDQPNEMRLNTRFLLVLRQQNFRASETFSGTINVNVQQPAKRRCVLPAVSGLRITITLP